MKSTKPPAPLGYNHHQYQIDLHKHLPSTFGPTLASEDSSPPLGPIYCPCHRPVNASRGHYPSPHIDVKLGVFFQEVGAVHPHSKRISGSGSKIPFPKRSFDEWIRSEQSADFRETANKKIVPEPRCLINIIRVECQHVRALGKRP
ncbi:MAG: hypothetical protein CM1200mP27_08270 [Chloroflexota bacterium]|nr:MAG: hypothetical protein CM1200mP27_08270 [Chloroflexota bacterium]